MKISDLDLLIPGPPPEPLVKPRWGTVTQASPLRVQLDGDTAALAITPASLMTGLSVGSRVWCVLTGKQLIIVGSISGSGIPAGTIQLFAGTSLPSGWLWAAGDVYSPTSYPRLFAAIGTTYGGTSGSPLLPDLRGLVPVMQSSDAEFDTLGEKGGAKTHTLTTAEIPAHSHAFTASKNGVNQYYNGWPSWTNPGANGTADIATHSDGGSGGAHNNLQPYITLNYIIQAV